MAGKRARSGYSCAVHCKLQVGKRTSEALVLLATFSLPRPRVVIEHMEGVVCEFSRSGEQLAVCGGDGEVKIWDCASEALKQRLKPTSAAIACLSWSRLAKVSRAVLVNVVHSFHQSQEKERNRLLKSNIWAFVNPYA